MKQFVFILFVLIVLVVIYITVIDGANPILCALREAVGSLGCPDSLSMH